LIQAIDSTEAPGWQTLELVSDVRPDARNVILRLEADAVSSALFDDVALEIVGR
jgi:hypothetical protein